MFRTVSILTLSILVSFGVPPAGRAAGDVPKPRAGGSRWNVAIVVYDHMEILDFAGPAEVFEVAGGSRAYNVYTVAETDRPIVSQGFVKITPQYTIANCPPPDLVVIPGGNTVEVRKSEKMRQWVTSVARDSGHVLTVCTGAFVVAKAGLLDGLEATTHHSAIERMRREFPKIKVRSDVRVVDNGKILTTAGVSAGIDGALYVVAKMCGTQVAQRTAEGMEYRWHPEATLTTAAAKSPAQAALEAWFLGNWKQAVEGYKSLATTSPDDSLVHYRLGVALSGAGNYQEAIQHLQQATELGLRDTNALDQLGRAQLSAKRPADAAKTFEQALELNKGDSKLLYNLACAHALSGQKDKALQALEKAFQAGFGGGEYASTDDDLSSLRDDPRFQAMTRKFGANGA
jgi:putative intracellular protease/amidase/Flp pilus assembly protein TadD